MWRLIVEADGRCWHTRIDDFERDRWRDNVATTHGYDVLRFTYRQLTAGREEALALLQRYASGRRTAA
jgi:very-short-patch-repair endonuclease